MVEWRPSKVKWFVEALEIVLNDNELDVIILTDNELRIACNDLLEPWKQISKSTFENWKAWVPKNSKEYKEFLGLYKKALINQKRNLFKPINNWENNWQSRSWIIERKFSDWNLRQITENNNNNTNTNLNIEVEESEEVNNLLKDNNLT